MDGEDDWTDEVEEEAKERDFNHRRDRINASRMTEQQKLRAIDRLCAEFDYD